MLYDNFAMLTKRELLIRIVKLFKGRKSSKWGEVHSSGNAPKKKDRSSVACIKIATS